MIPLIYDTSSISQSEQFCYWNDLVCNTFTQLECAKARNPDSYQATLALWDLPQIQISVVNCDPCDVNHSNWLISKSTDDVFLMHLQLSGSSVNRQNGHEELLQSGDFALCSSTSPYHLSFDDPIQMMVVKIPRAILQKHIINPDLISGLKIDHTRGLSKILIQYLRNLWELRGSINSLAQKLELSNIVLSLLSTTYNLELTNQVNTDQGSVAQGHMQRIKIDIDNNLNNPDLSPDSIARSNNISTRYLRMLFSEGQMTFGRYVLNRRLETVAKCLQDSRYQNLKINEVAFRWGFNNPSHFSKVFRDHFELTPKQFKEKALKPEQ